MQTMLGFECNRDYILELENIDCIVFVKILIPSDSIQMTQFNLSIHNTHLPLRILYKYVLTFLLVAMVMNPHESCHH